MNLLENAPFNIGKSIDLSGFTLVEAQPLAAGLAEKSENPQTVLEAILYWTGGQPFLMATTRPTARAGRFNTGMGHRFIFPFLRSRATG
jgi:hypothetical protein